MAKNDPNILFKDFSNSASDWLSIGTPWITHPAIDFLEVNLLPTDVVLEYGCGRSTVYWAMKAKKVTCIEGSPRWSIYVLLFLYSRPELIKKTRLYFSPAEWNPDFSHPKDYWKVNRGSITTTDVSSIERDLIAAEFPGHNILFFDGNIRPLVFTYKMTVMNLSEIDMIIIDNTEGPETSALADVLIPDNQFFRLDFPAGETDPIPSHQKGFHMSTIFMNKRRPFKEIATRHPMILSFDERKKYQPENAYSLHEAKRAVDNIRIILTQRLGFDLRNEM